MTGVMQRATLSQVDPAEAYKPRIDVKKTEARIRSLRKAIETGAKGPGRLRQEIAAREAQLATEQQRKSDHSKLKTIFDSMSPEAQTTYRATRDMFRKQYDTLEDALKTRLETLEADDQTKQALRAMVEKTFESGRIDPYFPLSRYGDYWAVAKDADGEVVAYSQFEKVTEWRDWKANMREQGYKVDGKRDTQAGKTGEGPKLAAMDPGFTLDVVKGLKGLKQQPAEVTNLIDDIWQTYLRSLPEMSARKQFIHRKGVMGFTGDGLRSVADASLRNARRIAKVEYQYQIENELAQLDQEAAQIPEETDPWAQQVVDEMRQRHEWAMDHTSSPIATTLTSLGFHNYLGMLRPSAGLVNLTQTAIVGLPTLSAYTIEAGGKGSAFVELSKASKDVTTLFQRAKDPFADPDTNKRFSKDVRRPSVTSKRSLRSSTKRERWICSASRKQAAGTSRRGGTRRARSPAGYSTTLRCSTGRSLHWQPTGSNGRTASITTLRSTRQCNSLRTRTSITRRPTGRATCRRTGRALRSCSATTAPTCTTTWRATSTIRSRRAARLSSAK